VSRAEGAAEEWVGRKPRREATKSDGAETEKCGDLFLVLYLKLYEYQTKIFSIRS